MFSFLKFPLASPYFLFLCWDSVFPLLQALLVKHAMWLVGQAYWVILTSQAWFSYGLRSHWPVVWRGLSFITQTFEDYTETPGLAPYFNRLPVASLLQVDEGTPSTAWSSWNCPLCIWTPLVYESVRAGSPYSIWLQWVGSRSAWLTLSSSFARESTFGRGPVVVWRKWHPKGVTLFGGVDLEEAWPCWRKCVIV